MGLNENYVGIRGQILLMRPLPTIEQAYPMLEQEEKQRGMANAMIGNIESVALKSSSNSSYNGAKYKSTQGRKECEFCGKIGHTRDVYYKLHGYHSNQ